MTPETFSPLIRTQHDLEQAWTHLMSPLGFGGHSILQMLAAQMPDGRFAFLRSRPGRGVADTVDLEWAAVLYAAARAAGVVCEVVHLATADAVVPMPQDALAVSRSSRRE